MSTHDDEPIGKGEMDWDGQTLYYSIIELEGTPEGGNGSDVMIAVLGNEIIKIDNCDGWGAIITVNGRAATEEQLSKYIDIETSIIHDYLKKSGNSEQDIEDYWYMHGVQAEGGKLVRTVQ